MGKYWLLLLIIASILLLTTGSTASTRYVAQTAGTFTGGSACNGQSAITVATFNSTAQAAGDVNYLCGTISASPGASNFISINGGGSSGKPVSLIFDTGATVTAPYWSGCAITLNSNSYITVNGGANGTIQATANGTGLANQQDNGKGLCSGTGVSNVVIENLTISNLYVHSCTEPVSNCGDSGGGDTYGIDLWGGSNDSVHNNTVHDMKWAIYIPYGSGASTSTNLNVYNNTVYNMDHGVVFADQGDGSVLVSSNCSSAIYNNDFSAMQPWDENADDNHHDAVHVWANNTSSGSSYTGVCVYDNYFHGDAGATDNSIFGMESYGNGDYVFNNIVNVSGSSSCASGAIGFWTGTGSSGSAQHAFNNTVLPTATCSISVNFEQNAGGIFENNLILSGNSTYVYTDGSNGTLTTVDYNYYQTPAGANPFYGPSGCPSGASFSTWQSGCGFDTHGHNAAVTINAAPFTLPSGSAAIGAGTNLTSLGITALDTSAPATFGVSGSCGAGCIARPATGAWDVGAYEYSGVRPSPPTGLVATPY